MKIAIAGSHGLIGNNLVTFFRKSNYQVSRIVRSKEQNGIFWDPLTGYYEWNFPDITYRKKKIVNQEIRLNYKNTLIGIYGSKIK